MPIRAGAQVSIQPARKPFKAIRTRTYPPAQWEVDSTTLLLQERQEMWHNVTRYTTVGVVLIAVVLLLMLIFLT